MNRLWAWLVPIPPFGLAEFPWWLQPVRHYNCRCALVPVRPACNAALAAWLDSDAVDWDAVERGDAWRD